MFRLVFLFIVLGLGLFVGTQFSDQQGYVLISFADTTTEMSVTTLVIFVVAALAVLFLLEAIIKRGLRASSATWNWFSVRKLKRSRRYTNEGIIKLLEGDWKGAEKKVTRWANHHDMPLLCYLIASEAAQGMGDDAKREKYLALAAEQDSDSLAVKLIRVKQLLRNKQFSQAYDEIDPLKDRYPNNDVVLNLLKETYLGLHSWVQLEVLLPSLKKNKTVNDEEYAMLFDQVQVGLMSDIAAERGASGLLTHWNQLPKKLKQDENMIRLVITQLLENDGDAEAYTILRTAIKNNPSEKLVPLLPHITLPETKPALELMEGIVKKHPDNAEVNSVLGQLYLKEEKWPEAQQALETALHHRVKISDYSFLADALERQNMKQAAVEVSRKALTLVEEAK
ncbi:MAG: heme biosynthesis protein HemY [Vibrio sp.]